MSKGRDEATFSPLSPHFFKIILEKTLRENKLLIPKKFVRLYGKSLSDSVCVKVPCGSEWEMEVGEFEGRVWLGKGWERFVEHYSIVKGHMICFRYEGNSRFEAMIFDTSTVEIDYPCKGSVGNSGDFIARQGKRKKFQSSGCQDGKRRRTSPVDEPKINPCGSKPRECRRNKTVLEESERKGGSWSFEPEMEGKQDLPSTSEFKRKRSLMSRKLLANFKFTRNLERYQNSAALLKANCFTSDRPFFRVLMQPRYINKYDMNIPRNFAWKYLEFKSTTAILKVPNGRNKIWPVKQNFVTYGTCMKASLSCGWKNFIQGNNLKVGDVCVFVLLKRRIKVTYRVVIFRFEGNSRPLNSSGSTPEDWCEKSSEIKTEPDVDIENKTPVDKDRFPERAPFVSEKPFFKLFIQPSYTGVSLNSCMHIPLDIAHKFFKKEGDIILRVPNHGSWSVQCKWSHSRETGRPRATLTCGWKVFAKGNNLKVGDVCSFQLVDGKETSFEVSIIRVSEDLHCQQVKEENDLEYDGAMKNETRTYNLRERSPVQGEMVWHKVLTMVEKTKFLERSYLKSKKPFFKPIPNDFAENYIKEDRDAILRVQNGTRSWPVRFKLRRLRSTRLCAEITHGWKEFAKCNNLRVGDVCIFELTNKTDIWFNVSIVRTKVDDALQQCFQDGGSSKCSTKVQMETKSVKIEVE